MTEILHPAQWLRGAERDLTAATDLADRHLPGLASVVAFHAQQCAERALKAVLMHRQADIVHTHDIAKLIAAVRAEGVAVPSALDASAHLSQYAVQARYGEIDLVTASEAREAVALAEAVLAWAASLVSQP